jgi:selenocysteine-specific elongation factor
MYVIGTAGHVDHGKSTLVRALTGIDPDRLAEEKAREMTIDLGFAWLKLPSGREVGVVDVPGHEHFIKNMLAGIGGIDLVLFVIAANEGVMPQTREHLAIVDLIEVQKGIVVVTKIDQADEDQITLITMEIEDLVKPTVLAGAPIVPVSASTGKGLPELVNAIDTVLSTARPRKDIGRPRLPIDRIFTISGSGTVITGTLADGSLSIGQEVEIVPPQLKSRIRGLQTHKTHVETAGPGSRVAANLVGLSSSDLKRGDVLIKPGTLTPTDRVDARMRLLSAAKHAFHHNAEVSFHTGSVEVSGKVRLLEKEEAQPGETVFVQIVLDEPVAVMNGDHFIVRSPMDTLGGGVVLEAHARQRNRRARAETVQNLKDRSEGKTAEIILATLRTRQPQTAASLVAQSNLPAELAESTLEFLAQGEQIVAAGQGKDALLFTEPFWKSLSENIVAAVQDYHSKFPLRAGMPKAELSSKLKLGNVFAPVLQKLLDNKVLAEEFAMVRLSSYQIKLAPAQQSKIDSYLKQLGQNPYAPAPDVALEPDLLNLLIDRRQIVKTASGVTFSARAYDEMAVRILASIKQNGKITLAEVRDMFQTSRKYAQALLEYMDEKKITKRVGDDRVVGEKAAGT